MGRPTGKRRCSFESARYLLGRVTFRELERSIAGNCSTLNHGTDGLHLVDKTVVTAVDVFGMDDRCVPLGGGGCQHQGRPGTNVAGIHLAPAQPLNPANL